MQRGAGAIEEHADLELAAELLSAGNARELDRILASVVGRVARHAGRPIPAELRAQLRSGLVKIARRLLPDLAAAPAIRGVRGSTGTRGTDRKKAGRMLGLELEGLSPEDQEFETARGVVRLAARAAARALRSAPALSPVAAARHALLDAARAQAPGILGAANGVLAGAVSSGRWVRRGDAVIVMGA